MEGEFNELKYNNTNITFTQDINNTATSDELSAPLMYQDKMGTEYSKRKRVGKVIGVTGIVLITTAAAIKVGGLLSNGFVIDPPTVTDTVYVVMHNEFSYKFHITNERNYEVIYYIDVNGKHIVKEMCTEELTYEGTFSEFQEGDTCEFYITFTNRFDYRRTIEKVRFNTGGIIK